MSDVNAEAVAWLERFSAALGVAPPTAEDVETLLAVAGHAAHSSHRQAAPVACWLAARAGLTPRQALAAAQALDPA